LVDVNKYLLNGTNTIGESPQERFCFTRLFKRGESYRDLQEEILGRRFARRRWSSVLLLATTFVPFDRFRKPHKRSRFFQMEKRIENKRHTNADQPLTSPSTIGATIPPLRHIVWNQAASTESSVFFWACWTSKPAEL